SYLEHFELTGSEESLQTAEIGFRRAREGRFKSRAEAAEVQYLLGRTLRFRGVRAKSLDVLSEAIFGPRCGDRSSRFHHDQHLPLSVKPRDRVSRTVPAFRRRERHGLCIERVRAIARGKPPG